MREAEKAKNEETIKDAQSWMRPDAGIESHVSRGSLVEPIDAKVSPLTSMAPGNSRPKPLTTHPRKAAMATRPCLISAARYHASVSSDALFERPSGSKKPVGAWM